MESKTYITMDYNELEKIIEKAYGHKYEFVAQEELSNDTTKDYNDVKAETLDEWAQKDLDEFIITGRMKCWRTHILLTHLVNTGVLQPGNYLITVSW